MQIELQTIETPETNRMEDHGSRYYKNSRWCKKLLELSAKFERRCIALQEENHILKASIQTEKEFSGER